MKAVERKSGGKLYNEHAIRYMFYPLRRLDFAGSQPTSPIFVPQFPKQEIVALESFPYKVVDDTESPWDEITGKPRGLMDKIMGTDAQVKFLMGDNMSGLQVSGMSYLDSVTNVDKETVAEIENLILEGKTYENLIELKGILEYKLKNGFSGSLAEKAREVCTEMLDGVNRAIAFCQAQANELENEINNAKTGKMSMKSGLDARDKYLYDQIKRPYPDDKAGTNMGSELARVLAPLIGGAPLQTPEQELDARMKDLELQKLKAELAEARQVIREIAGETQEDIEPESSGKN